MHIGHNVFKIDGSIFLHILFVASLSISIVLTTLRFDPTPGRNAFLI